MTGRDKNRAVFVLVDIIFCMFFFWFENNFRFQSSTKRVCFLRLMGDMKRHGIFILGDETISHSNAQLKKGQNPIRA